MEKIIEFNNVSKNYDSETHALNNVSVSIEKGEFAFIVGASGAGKSTFLKLIMHEESPSSGTIIVNGTDVTKLRSRKVPYLRRNMGIVFQDFRLIEKMTVYDNVAFAMRAIGAPPAEVKKRVPYILGLVGLSHKLKNRPSELSGGEQQRVSLARALVNNPAIIIADEPTGNIDPEMSYEIIELLSKINEEQGTTILVVTHEHELVRQFNKRVIEIEKGSVVNDTKGISSDAEDILFTPSGENEQPDEIETDAAENAPEADESDIKESDTSGAEQADTGEEVQDEAVEVNDIPEAEKTQGIEESTKNKEPDIMVSSEDEKADVNEEVSEVEKIAEVEETAEVEKTTEPDETAEAEETAEVEETAEDEEADKLEENSGSAAAETSSVTSSVPEERLIDEILADISSNSDKTKIDDLAVDVVLAELRETLDKDGDD